MARAARWRWWPLGEARGLVLALGERMRRRQFFTLLGSMAIAWPIDADAQKPNQVRRIVVLMPYASDDMAGLRRARIFAQALQDLGWTDGRNARIDYRWPDGDIEKIQALAKELVSSRPDVLVGVGTPQVAELRQATRTIPIVFLLAGDAVDEGVVERMARPGGNATFFALERSMGGKWLELLKEIAPGLRWVAVIFNPETAAVGTLYLRSVEAAAALLSVKATGAPVHHAGDLERAISPLAREPGGGLSVRSRGTASTASCGSASRPAHRGSRRQPGHIHAAVWRWIAG
jgi:ABC-type uncharacterized transport system substrate-binding protein